MQQYTIKRRRGEPGFKAVVALVLAIWLFYMALIAGAVVGLFGLLFLIKAIFF